MQDWRAALVQVGWLGSVEAMQSQYRELVAQAAAHGARLVCLPEFSLIPYFPGTTDPRGFDWAEPLPGGVSERTFAELARSYNVTLIGSLFERDAEGRYWDTATIHAPTGEMIGATRKIHIPSGEGYNETHFFGGGSEYPVFDIGALHVATPTCYDQWFPELARIYSLNGAEFIFYPTAIGSEPTDPHIDTAESWQTVMRGHAIANGVYIGAANRVGVENGVTFYGSSFVCDPTGRILAQAERAATEVLVVDLSAHQLEHWRTLFPLLRQRRPETYHRISEA